MKVTLISFDYFDFDKNIIDTLHQKGIEAQHIDISKFRYRYKSGFEKIKNFFSKAFFGVNVKRVKMEEYVLSRLESLGPQDQILVIRPDRISRKTHEKIKGYTQKYIAYLYDSTNRFPVDHLLKGLYDTIYTFDLDDADKYGFRFISNYIYIDKKPLVPANELPTDIFMIASIDERLSLWNQVSAYCREKGIQTDFICVGKREPAELDAGIVYSKNNLFLEAIENRMFQSKAFLDLIRTEQNGLSFRIFEAMAYQRKIITSNASVTRYPFYNPNNILVLNESTISDIKTFMERPFEPLTEEMYHHYTVSNWVDTVFEL